MSNKRNTPQIFLVAIIAIISTILVSHVSSLGGLMLLLPIPFALFATLVDIKRILILLVIAFICILTTGNNQYIIEISLTAIIPGIIIGSVSKNTIFDEQKNKFQPIYVGIIVNMCSTIAIYIISKEFFNIDLLEQYRILVEMVVTQQKDFIISSGLDIDINIEDTVIYMNNIVSTIIFFQSVIMTLVTYSGQILVINMMKIQKTRISAFSEFYLPGNTVLISLILYGIVMLLDIFNIGLKTELILINLQNIFYTMFIIQGTSICIYYIKKWIKEKQFRVILICGLIFGILGIVAVSLLGMLDSINDFRKVRNYKPM